MEGASMRGVQGRDEGFFESTEDGAPRAIGEVIEARLSRRQALRGLTAAAVTTVAPSLAALLDARPARAVALASTLSFAELPHGQGESHAVAAGYEATTLIRWGDPLEPGAPTFDPLKQTAAAQARQWGYNNDYVGYLPLPMGSVNPDRGLLCVNFEYTIPHLMFPGLKPDDLSAITREQCEIEMAAHGHGIVEIRRDGAGRWGVVGDSRYNRRITAFASECRITGPAAGHSRLRTSSDPTGTKVLGTLNNCAGGKTPWNTVLIAEENFNYYFGGDPAKTTSTEQLRMYGIVGRPAYAWSQFFDILYVYMYPI
jgi:secreted PhoX family phosphatase